MKEKPEIPSREIGVDESEWLTYAKVLAIIGVTLLAFATWRWGFEGGAHRADRMRTLYYAAIVLGAAVTFCTVVWRGMIASRQADYQQKQLDGLARQIEMTEVSEMAQQLQKGAELVAEENEARASAGIATLGAVAQATPELFGDQARRLLLDFVRDKGSTNHNGENVKRAAEALLEAFKKRPAIVLNTNVYFYARNLRDSTGWEFIFGPMKTKYKGGNFFSENLPDFEKFETTIFYFEKVTFKFCNLPLINHNPIKCIFENCKILSIDEEAINNNNFVNCDFSGSKIYLDINGKYKDLKKNNNFFNDESEPSVLNNIGGPVDPKEFLLRVFREVN